jgi:DNA-binding NarL/FixJ family response regulator
MTRDDGDGSSVRHAVESRTLPVDTGAGPGQGELTPREREILALVGTAMSNDEIGDRLTISKATAKTHVSRIMGELEARDRAQLVVIAYESGLVTPSRVSH